MSFKATTRIGVTTIAVEAKDIKDLFKQIGVFTELPSKCDCGSDQIRFKHRVAKGYDFYSLGCQCGKEFALGQTKEGEALFPKGPWAIPQRGNNQSDDSYSQSNRSSNVADDDDIPF